MRITVEKNFDSSKKYIEAYGTSTEDKPTTGIITGSCFIEVDTGKAFLFNEDATAWVEQ